MKNQGPKTKKTGELAEREAEATDKETLKDLEDSFGSSDINQKDQKKVPSPDGAFDEVGELKQADPM